MRLCRYPIVYLCGLWALALGGCAAEDDAASPEEALRRKFPAQADVIVGPRAGEIIESSLGQPEQTPRAAELSALFVKSTEKVAKTGEAEGRREGYFRELDIQLPEQGADAVRFQVGRGAEVVVREAGAYGEAEAAGTAVAYARSSGVSYWSRADGGFEEWLLLEEGAAYADQAVAAWEVVGAQLRQQGDFIEALDDEGVPRLRVAAPAAFTVGGREVTAKLVAQGDHRIELSVDADGEEVLADPSWTPTSAMITPRQDHITALLPSGKALAAGGTGKGVKGPTALCEVYDPATDVWAPTGPMIQARDPDSFVTLADGRVFVAGGDAGATGPTATAEAYNPNTGIWSATTSMSSPRRSAAITLLASGKVLVTGGVSASGFLKSAEIFDPGANKWSAATPMNVPRAGHRATLMKNGKVLVTGGASNAGSGALKAAEIYDPILNVWSTAPDLKTPRMLHKTAALPNGKVLVVDAADADLGEDNAGNAELYDPTSGTWSPGGLTIFGGESTALVPLDSGKVLRVVFTFDDSTSLAEIYDPQNNTWSAAKPLSQERRYASAALLSTGRVLVTGGAIAPGAILIPFAEMYDPGEAIGAVCKVGGDCSSGFCVDGMCCDSACDAGPCVACSIKAGAAADGVCGPRTGACDDGNPCTRDETCQEGVCAGSAVTCTAIDACHETGTCDPSTGLCSSPERDDGAACPSGVCEAGHCSPQTGPSSITSKDPSSLNGGGCSCEVARSNRDATPLFTGLLVLLARRLRKRRGAEARR